MELIDLIFNDSMLYNFGSIHKYVDCVSHIVWINGTLIFDK